jgi:hypothetical protein
MLLMMSEDLLANLLFSIAVSSQTFAAYAGAAYLSYLQQTKITFQKITRSRKKKDQRAAG